MNGLGKRLTALEEIAERARLAELRVTVREQIQEIARARGMTLTPDELERGEDRAMDILALIEAGSTLAEATQIVAGRRQ